MAARVLGVGVDVVRVPRVAGVLARHGERFLRRAFHPGEARHARALPTAEARHAYLASRWAVKEATLKAFGRWRIAFPEVSVVADAAPPPPPLAASGDLPPRLRRSPPALRLDGAAKELAAALSVSAAHVSLSHDGEYAAAHVVLETSA